MSNATSSTQPIEIAPASSARDVVHSPSSAQSPSSALSASLKAFSDLSLANRPPVNLESDEFKQAYHHARRASFGNGNAPATRPILIQGDHEQRHVPALSTSPGSNVSDLSSLPTPSSSPPSTSAVAASTPSAPLKRSASNGGNANGKTAAVPILGGVCEKEEIEALESGELFLDEPASAPAPHHHHSRSFSSTEGSALFGGGARWGWPGSSGSGTSSPPQQQQPVAMPLRRASLAFASPPGGLTAPLPAASTSATVKHSPPLPPTQTDPFARMQPLGRVVSAGASLQTPHDGSGTGEGLGSLFRRFSIGGFGSKKRPQPPSPPSLALPPRGSTLTAPESTPGPNAQDESRSRGRTLGSPGSAPAAKPKRRLSPMSEKILRGGY
ncbi:hypothetical protein JCM3766R1_003452 [Sporobolomyces carnicolor]